MLPVKMHDKLMFPLCSTCCQNLSQEVYEHSEREQMLTGTWVCIELDKAVEKGYQDIYGSNAEPVPTYDAEDDIEYQNVLYSGFVQVSVTW